MSPTQESDPNHAWLYAATLAAFTAIVTAGANAIAEEVKARWAEQRKVKNDASTKE